MHGVSLTAQHLYCYVAESKSKKKEESGRWKKILNDVTLCIPAGRLVAVMGPSGSGKSTLLNLLAGQTTPKIHPVGYEVRDGPIGTRQGAMLVSGDVKFNGKTLDSMYDVVDFSGYVRQEDHLMDYLTVEESITFSAHLKLKYLPREEKEIRVQEVIDTLALNKCRNTPIGGVYKKGVSGGEKKRVSLAIEMLSNPSLIFLDEPTSGLDSSLAYDVVKCLRAVANTGRTVIVTIHQPRSQSFALFDDLVLLESGRIVYHGLAPEAISYFGDIGFKCPEKFNPADFFLDILTVESKFGGSDVGSDSTSIIAKSESFKGEAFRIYATAEQIESLPATFQNSNQMFALLEDIETINSHPTDIPINIVKPNAFKRVQKWFSTIGVLSQRYILNIGRNPSAFLFDVIIQTIVALFVGMIFLQMDIPDYTDEEVCHPEQDHNLMGVVNSVIANLAFANIANVISIPNDRPMSNREKSGGFYRPSAGFLGFSTSAVVFDYFGPIVFGTLIYWMVGFSNKVDMFFEFILFVMAAKYASTGYSNFIGAVVPNATIAMVLAPLGNVLFMIVSGFLCPDSSIPVWFIWLKYISYIRYSFQSLLNCVGPNKNYLISCMNLDSNIFGMWGNFGMVILVGTVLRFMSYLGVRFLYTHHGLQD